VLRIISDMSRKAEGKPRLLPPLLCINAITTDYLYEQVPSLGW